MSWPGTKRERDGGLHNKEGKGMETSPLGRVAPVQRNKKRQIHAVRVI